MFAGQPASWEEAWRILHPGFGDGQLQVRCVAHELHRNLVDQPAQAALASKLSDFD